MALGVAAQGYAQFAAVGGHAFDVSFEYVEVDDDGWGV
jgi:hypothetical protein